LLVRYYCSIVTCCFGCYLFFGCKVFFFFFFFSELKVLREVIQTEKNKNTPVGILNYIKKLESFSNACIAYRILLTIPVTVTSAERIFSKLKLIKSYLRSTISQERLSELAILSIERNMLEKIDYKSLINNFASKRARKMKF
jgi:hypothetical protein